LLPELAELFDGCWSMARELIVGVRVDDHASLSDLVAIVHPAVQFMAAVNDRFIPSCCLGFNAFAVAMEGANEFDRYKD
jgi:hypothetical protein